MISTMDAIGVAAVGLALAVVFGGWYVITVITVRRKQ